MTDEIMKPLPVKGYTDQPKNAIEIVNRFKEVEERILRALDEMRKDGDVFDQRWLSIGFTHIQEGFMAINRSVFKPQRIALPEDQKDKPND